MADKEQYHLSKPAEWIDKVITGAVIGTEPMPGLSEQFKSQFRENIGAADATAKWQPLGFFDTVEDLIATVTTPAPGDAYAVGVEEPFDIWVWDGVNQRWRNGGNLKGMDGKDGEDGEDGSDANVTAENIIAALGYTPADAENVGVPDGSIGTAQLANGAVTAEKLDPNIDLGSLKFTFLWRNAAPTSSLAPTTINAAEGEAYDGYLVTLFPAAVNRDIIYTYLIKVYEGKNAYAWCGINSLRTFRTYAEKLDILAGYIAKLDAAGNASTTENNSMSIAYEVYGVRGLG